MNHVAEWDTPTLVIHSGKDYRLVDGEGIGEWLYPLLPAKQISNRILS